ncbi:hypothetical protein O4215_20435 [Rhodococcus maanshanensis]|uniref:hypothetical protein n=1 Tax=Rhodococcus maanshanensis TaxID=183556 RepID=UPI0022B3F046|nr:hypothetical protein [Rhodococcus maanshanensis]MCZ4557932.1 hypothetical protein [Rhodococcus maanshanensis]
MTVREHARLRLDIWGDDDFRALSVPAQHLYLTLLTEPTLNYAGVADWRPSRIASKAHGWTPAAVNTAGRELAERLFIVVDEATEEVLVRSFIKHDGLMKNPRMVVSMMTAYAGVASDALRGVIVHEVRKLHENQPDLSAWTSTISGDRVTVFIRRRPLDPSTFPTGYPHAGADVLPFDSGSTSPSTTPSVKGSITPKPTPKVSPSVKGSPSPTPAPTPTPTTSNEVVEREPAKKRAGSRLPENWMPGPETIAKMQAEFPNVNLEAEHAKFADHFIAVPGARGIKADWDATWRNWIRRAGEGGPGRSVHAAPTPRPVMPNGHQLTPAEMKFAQAEALKDNPDARILAAAGIPMPKRDTGQLDVWGQDAIEASA